MYIFSQEKASGKNLLLFPADHRAVSFLFEGRAHFASICVFESYKCSSSLLYASKIHFRVKDHGYWDIVWPGINAYLPLLSLAIATDVLPDHFKINPQFGFITQPWCIVILAILTLADVFADKIPVVDHLWDAIHTVIRPVAGALVASAANPQATGGWLPITLALGGGLAAMLHVTKASTRVASTATTGGLGNIVLSILEDIAAVIGVLLSLIAPYVMIVIIVLFVIVFLLLVPRIVRVFKRRRQRARVRAATNPTYPGRY
jgi:hypothetical protein